MLSKALHNIVLIFLGIVILHNGNVAQNGTFEGSVKNDKGEELPFVILFRLNH
jgi:hypothetical protein